MIVTAGFPVTGVSGVGFDVTTSFGTVVGPIASSVSGVGVKVAATLQTQSDSPVQLLFRQYPLEHTKPD